MTIPQYPLLLFTLLSLTACVFSPSSSALKKAARIGLQTEQISGKKFMLTGFTRNIATTPQPLTTLHIYFGGDGSPWLRPKIKAADPTSRNPLVFHLMAKDPNPSLLLSRPCYHRDRTDGRCQPRLWTSARYSEEVVQEMHTALTHWLKSHPAQQITLIGYSGGGVLAALLARRLANVSQVIGLATNYDTNAWCQFHGWTPLRDSLNPALLPPLPATVRQLYLFGEEDNNVPFSLMQPALPQQADTQILPGVSHRSGWQERWPEILHQLEERRAANPPAGTAD